MSEDTLQKRYFYKLSTNIIILLVNLISQAIIPRALGPKAYGDFNFLTNFFSQLTGFLDMGSSVAFYTKLSRRQDDFGLVSFYGRFAMAVAPISLLFVVIIQVTGYSAWLWPDQELFYIYLAAGLGILIWGIQVLSNMADAYGITVVAEKVRIIQKFLGLLIIGILFIMGTLHLTGFFLYNYFVMLILVMGLLWAINRHACCSRQDWRLSREAFVGYFKEYYKYCHPLFLYSVVSLVTGVFDRWFLQMFGGSVEQGFFGLSYQIGAFCLLFIGALTPLFIREFSIAFGKRDSVGMAHLFRRYVPLFYSIAAYFSCFVAVQAGKVIYLLGGKQYQGALLAVAIMACYPIHQTYAQLSGSVFLATGQTAIYRNIGIVFMALGVPMTYLLIAPVEKFGFNAGATGLALKMVLLGIVWVNVQLYFNAKFLKLRFIRYVGHQIIILGVLLALSLVSCKGMDYLLKNQEGILTNFIISGIIYTILTIAVSYYFPNVFGLNKDDLRLFFQKILLRRSMSK